MRYALYFLVLVLSISYYGRWHDYTSGNGGDAWGYYAYLPALFIHGDLADDLKKTVTYRKDGKQVLEKIQRKEPFEAIASDENYVIKYTSGVAILLLPFFLIAHMLALILGDGASGFGTPYSWMVFMGSAVYVLLGMWYLEKVLRRYFKPRNVIVATLIILFGTNLYYFLVRNSIMAHPLLFALYCFLIYFSDERHRSGNTARHAGAIGLLCGLITLIRPTELICVLIPLLWGVSTFKALGEPVVSWLKPRTLVVVAGCALLINIPQLIYWKAASGKWLFYSYGEEGFNFLHPRTLDGWFAPNNGWLIYTPIMILAVIGLVFMYKKCRTAFWPVTVFFVIHVYVIYCWWNWFYINGFGSRPMIEAYALLSIPLCVLLEKADKKRWTSVVLASAIGLFVFLNQFQTWQHSKGILWTEYATWPHYFAVFGKTSMPESGLIGYDRTGIQPTGTLQFNRLLIQEGFDQEGDTSSQILPPLERPGKFELRNNETKKINIPLIAHGIKKGDWLKVSCKAYAVDYIPGWFGMAVVGADYKYKNEVKKHHYVRIQNKIDNPNHSLWGGQANKWGEAYFFYKIRTDVQPADHLEVYGRNVHGNTVFLDEIKVEVWK